MHSSVKKKEIFIPIIIALLSALLFGISTPVSKFLLEKIPAVQLAGFLYLGAAVILIPFFVKERHTLKTLMQGSSPQNTLVYLTGAIFFGGILGPVLLLTGLSLTFAGSAALLLNFETVVTAIIAFLFFKEHFSKMTWAANFGVFISGLILSFEGEFQGFVGAIFILGAGVCWGLDNNFTANIDGISPIQSTFIKGFTAGTVNTIIGLVLFPHIPDLVFVFFALLIGSFSYGISIVLYITSAQRLGATRSQMFFASAPFWGLGFSILFLNETLTIFQMIASLILIFSLFLLFRDYHDHEHPHEYIYHTHPHDHTNIHHLHNHPDHDITDIEEQWHEHQPTTHLHPHWPDFHHRHNYN